MPSTRQNHAECVWVYVCVDEPCVHALWHRKYPKSTVISNINLKYNNLCNLVVFNIQSVSNEQTRRKVLQNNDCRIHQMGSVVKKVQQRECQFLPYNK